jgi:hypothetical protein
MILATHAVVGAAVARLFPHYPIIGFLAAFASHYVLDAIPHWNYHLRSFRSTKETGHGRPDMVWGRDFLIDLSRIALDGSLGVGLAFLLFRPQSWRDVFITLAGIVGGVLPDALEFLYWKCGDTLLGRLQRFHRAVHTKEDIKSPMIGIFLQAVLVGLVSLFFYCTL